MNNNSVRPSDAMVSFDATSDSEPAVKSRLNSASLHDLPEIFGSPKPAPGEAPSRISTQLFTDTALAGFDAADKDKDGYLDLNEVVNASRNGSGLEKSTFSVMRSSFNYLKDISNDEWLSETSISKNDLQKFDDIQKSTKKFLDDTREARAFILKTALTTSGVDDSGKPNDSLTKGDLEALMMTPDTLNDGEKTSMKVLLDKFDSLLQEQGRSTKNGLNRHTLSFPVPQEFSSVKNLLDLEDISNAMGRMTKLKSDGKTYTENNMRIALEDLPGSPEAKALAGQFNSALINNDFSAFKDTFVKSQGEPYFKESMTLFNRGLRMNRSGLNVSRVGDDNIVLYNGHVKEQSSRSAGIILGADGAASLNPVYSNEKVSILENGRILDKTPQLVFSDHSKALQKSVLDGLDYRIEYAREYLKTRRYPSLMQYRLR